MPGRRLPAVAGRFYPDDAAVLGRAVDEYVTTGRGEAGGPVPKALIAPHAGYIYSGPVAGSAYRSLEGRAGAIGRVVLLGPAHRVPVRGLALASVDVFETPLGQVPVDHDSDADLLALGCVVVDDAAHAAEHSLEVQLPFLQRILGDFGLVPLVVGVASAGEVAAVLERLWGGPETLIVVSSDLSHYLDQGSATRVDAATSQAIEELRPEDIAPEQACGQTPIRGLLQVARQRQMKAALVDQRTSGDTAGGRDQVVGYGAYVFA